MATVGVGSIGTAGALVVERQLPPVTGALNARQPRQAAHGFLELPEELRIVRVAEVQIVGDAQRHRAGAGEVAAASATAIFPPS